jgi:hypothetical protein
MAPGIDLGPVLFYLHEWVPNEHRLLLCPPWGYLHYAFRVSSGVQLFHSFFFFEFGQFAFFFQVLC